MNLKLITFNSTSHSSQTSLCFWIWQREEMRIERERGRESSTTLLIRRWGVWQGEERREDREEREERDRPSRVVDHHNEVSWSRKQRAGGPGSLAGSRGRRAEQKYWRKIKQKNEGKKYIHRVEEYSRFPLENIRNWLYSVVNSYNDFCRRWLWRTWVVVWRRNESWEGCVNV